MSTARDQGAAHRRARKHALALMRDGDACCLCGGPMYHGEHLDLDHNPHDTTQYRGLAHRYCNRSDGAKRGNSGRTVWLSQRW